MKKVFVGGSRRISKLNAKVKDRLDEMMRKRLTVLVGDANGADRAVQSYFADHGYDKVQIYCSDGDCRNNLGPWQVKSVKPPHRRRDFAFFTAKDAAMAEDADVGLMLWDGESAGTVVNVARLIAAGKPVVVYLAPEKKFQTLKSHSSFETLLNPCSEQIRNRLYQYVASHGRTQNSLF